jgi:hypothetical protein
MYLKDGKIYLKIKPVTTESVQDSVMVKVYCNEAPDTSKDTTLISIEIKITP